MSSIPAWTGGQRFIPGDPFSLDRCEVWRMVTTGTEDGTPVLARQKIGEVSCRIDSIRSRRSDLSFRTPVTAVHENFAIIFAPTNAPIQNDDELVPVSYPQERWLVVEISRAQGPTYIHHLEITATRVQGAA